MYFCWRMARWAGLCFLLLSLLVLGACSSTNTPSFLQDKEIRPSDPEVGNAHYLRAMYFKTQGDNLRAVQELEWAIQADPYNYRAHYQAGILYLALGHKEYAYQAWERGLQAAEDGVDRPDNPRGKAVAEMHAALAGISQPYDPMPYYEQEPVYTAPEPRGVHPEPLYPSSPSSAYYSPSPPPASYDYSSAPASSSAAAGKNSAAASSVKPAPAPAGSVSARKNPPLIPPKSITGPYAVLFSSNRQPASASNDVKKLKDLGYSAQVKTHKDKQGRVWHQVIVGCCSGRQKAEQLAAALKKRGLTKNPSIIRP